VPDTLPLQVGNDVIASGRGTRAGQGSRADTLDETNSDSENKIKHSAPDKTSAAAFFAEPIPFLHAVHVAVRGGYKVRVDVEGGTA
jgi:hypothetical protein